MPIQRIRSQLSAMAEPDYQAFSASLLPTIDKKTVLGVRMPKLRAYAKHCPPEMPRRFLQSCRTIALRKTTCTPF